MNVNRRGAALVIVGHLAVAWLALQQARPEQAAPASSSVLVRLVTAVHPPETVPVPVPVPVPRGPGRPLSVVPVVPDVRAAPAVEEPPAATAVAAAEPSSAQAEIAHAEPLLAAQPEHAFNPPPVHPSALLERGIGGVVWLRVLVERDGHAAEVQLLRGSGQRLLDESALDAVRRWRFVAARRGVQSLASCVEFPIRFTVRDPDQRAAL